MKFNEFTTEGEKTRLDPKCWTGKKIGNPKTKVKGGVRVNNCVPAESVEEGIMNKIANKVMGAAPEQPKYKVGQRVKYETSPHQPEWKDGGRGVGVITAYKNGHYMINGNPVNHFEIKGVVEQGVTEGSREQVDPATVWEVSFDYGPHQSDKVKVRASSQEEAEQKGMRAAKKLGHRFPQLNWAMPAEQGVAEGYDDEEHPIRDDGNEDRPGKQRYPGKLPNKDQGVAEAEKKLHPKTWHDVDKKLGKAVDKMSQAEKVAKGFAHPDTLKKKGVAEGTNDTIYPNAEVIKSKNGKPVGEIYQDGNSWGCFHYRADRGYDFINSREEAIEALKDLHQETGRSRPDYTIKGVAEGSDAEYDDEAGMADNNLNTLRRAVDGLDRLIDTGDNLPEWCQEKIAVAKSMLVAVWDYMESEDNEEEDPEVAEMYEAMESLVEEIAARDRVDVDLVWESFESLDDHMLYETAAWRRKEGKSKSGGLNAKGVASYRRENPGSKLQTAVTTKPSKLKKGSKAAKRRKSFCARMGGVKGPMKKPNSKPTRKALALRKWNC
jgi:hypothetical protein